MLFVNLLQPWSHLGTSKQTRVRSKFRHSPFQPSDTPVALMLEDELSTETCMQVVGKEIASRCEADV